MFQSAPAGEQAILPIFSLSYHERVSIRACGGAGDGLPFTKTVDDPPFQSAPAGEQAIYSNSMSNKFIICFNPRLRGSRRSACTGFGSSMTLFQSAPAGEQAIRGSRYYWCISPKFQSAPAGEQAIEMFEVLKDTRRVSIRACGGAGDTLRDEIIDRYHLVSIRACGGAGDSSRYHHAP